MTTQSTDAQKTARAMAALDTMAATWAAKFDIRQAVQAMMRCPDADDRLIAFVKQGHVEGLYEGRASHQYAGQLASMTRMFNAACVDLGIINEALELDPDDGGAELILSAIEELRKDAERYRFLRAQPIEGEAGQPVIALPNGMKSGYYINEETADFAVDKAIAQAAQA